MGCSRAHRINKYNKQIHNSLTVHYNSWNLKFDSFSEFQSVISDSAPPPPFIRERHYDVLRAKIDM